MENFKSTKTSQTTYIKLYKIDNKIKSVWNGTDKQEYNSIIYNNTSPKLVTNIIICVIDKDMNHNGVNLFLIKVGDILRLTEVDNTEIIMFSSYNVIRLIYNKDYVSFDVIYNESKGKFTPGNYIVFDIKTMN